MRLTDVEESMLAGDRGPACKWAIEHQLQVGRMFDATEMVPVSQAHMMADPESLGEAGVEFVERLAADGGSVSVPMITDPRGVDLNHYLPLGQTQEMADLERRFVTACQAMGIMMTDTCINYQTIMPPLFGEHVAYGDTGVVIYSNSVCGARSNFEGGPSALAAGLTGRTPGYGLHLESNRRATKRFMVENRPKDLMEWGVLRATIGRMAGSYWEVPVIEGIDGAPTSDEMKHFGAAMASWGSTPLFHMVGITPECRDLDDVGARESSRYATSRSRSCRPQRPVWRCRRSCRCRCLAAPQLSLVEMGQVAGLVSGASRAETTDLVVCTPVQVYGDAERLGYIEAIEILAAPC